MNVIFRQKFVLFFLLRQAILLALLRQTLVLFVLVIELVTWVDSPPTIY